MSPVTRTRILVVLSFIIAFAAGISLGAAVKNPPPPRRRGHGGFIAQRLHLTPEQHKQMSDIWSGLMQKMRANGERRRQLVTERDQALRSLLTPELQKKYDSIVKDYDKKLSDLSQEGGKAREEAWQQTKAILTDEQRKEFEELTKSQGPGPMRPRGDQRGWRPPGRGPRRGPPPPPGPPGQDHPAVERD